ncbi:MAG: hypothetical protein ACRDLN_13080 [Solirubrobacteraceae bacterium]
MSLKANQASQTTPGKVTISAVVCASKYAHGSSPDWTDCQPGNIFASDNFRADATSVADGQLLVGFRVPLGAEGPESFPSKDASASFTRSESYTSELGRFFPPPADQRWIGYISTVKHYDPASASRSLGFDAEFTLPVAAGGAPFAGPFRWRTVVGFRQGDPAAPVTCNDNVSGNPCFDSPTPDAVPTDVPNAVSDFGVLGGATTTAFAGTTAVVPFKLRYSDAAKLGEKSFSFSATTELPRTSAKPDRQTLSADADSTSEVAARVPVPASTPAGRYDVTLTGGIGSPVVTRAATGAIVVEPVPQQGSKPAPLPAAGTVNFGFIRPRKGTGRKVARMVVTGVPAGGTVTARCRGRGCAFKTKAVKRRRVVNLAKQFRGRTLKPLTVITVRISAKNRIAKEIRFTIRKVQTPAVKVRCRPPGSKKTLSCA